MGRTKLVLVFTFLLTVDDEQKWEVGTDLLFPRFTWSQGVRSNLNCLEKPILKLRGKHDTENEGKYSDFAVPVTGEEWLQSCTTLRSGSHDIWDLSAFWYSQPRGWVCPRQFVSGQRMDIELLKRCHCAAVGKKCKERSCWIRLALQRHREGTWCQDGCRCTARCKTMQET